MQSTNQPQNQDIQLENLLPKLQPILNQAFTNILNQYNNEQNHKFKIPKISESISPETAKANLLKHYTKFYNTTYTLQKYTAYINMPAPTLAKEIQTLTKQYIEEQKLNSDINKDIANKALQHHLQTLKSMIDLHKKRIQFNTKHLDDQPETIDNIKKEAYNATLATQKNAYNTIFHTIIYNHNRIHHEAIRNLASKHNNPDNIINLVESAIKLSDQITISYQHHNDTHNHIDNTTLPKYLTEHQLEWKGPAFNEQMQRLWQATHTNIQHIYLQASLDMFDLQINHLEQQLKPIYDQIPTDIRPLLHNIAASHAFRTHRTYTNTWKLDDHLTFLYNNQLDQPLNNLKEYLPLFIDINEPIRKQYNLNNNIIIMDTSPIKQPTPNPPIKPTNSEPLPQRTKPIKRSAPLIPAPGKKLPK